MLLLPPVFDAPDAGEVPLCLLQRIGARVSSIVPFWMRDPLSVSSMKLKSLSTSLACAASVIFELVSRMDFSIASRADAFTEAALCGNGKRSNETARIIEQVIRTPLQ